MKTFYKVFLIVLIVFTGINLYAIQWWEGAFLEDNRKFWFSIGAALLGIMVILIMHFLSKLEPATPAVVEESISEE